MSIVALIDRVLVRSRLTVALFAGSDGFGEFVQCRGYPQMIGGVRAEFVVASPNVLDERVASDHDRSGSVAFETSHWSKQCL